MGSPSTLFIIAKINSRYRSLAAVYRSHDNHSEFAVATCRKVISIIQAPANRSLVYYELELASNLPAETWDTEVNFRDEKPSFPFLATCLMLGASGNIKTEANLDGYNASHMPFNAPLENCAASEGITVLDVTDPTTVRYAFVLHGRQQSHWPTGRARNKFSNVPLMAWEYLAFYDLEFGQRSEYSNYDEEAAESKAEAAMTAALTGRNNADDALVPSPLIDEDTLLSAWPSNEDSSRRWRRRNELGLSASASATNDGTASNPRLEGELRRHSEVLYPSFERSYRMFSGDHDRVARLKKAAEAEAYKPVSPIKQILHLTTLGSMSEWPWEKRVADFGSDRSLSYRPGAVQFFRFPTDDAPCTPGVTLEMLHTCMKAASKDLGTASDYYSRTTTSPFELSQVKLLGLPGNGHAIKPLPGRAYYYAKAAYHCPGSDWMTVGLEELQPGEWTIIMVQHCEHERVDRRGSPPRTSLKSLSFKCAFISRDLDGKITTASAEDFRAVTSSSIEMEAAVALDPGEQDYGRELVEVLGRSNSAINGAPVTMMDNDEVQELLKAMDTVKAREDIMLEDSWSDEHWIIKSNRAKLAKTFA